MLSLHMGGHIFFRGKRACVLNWATKTDGSSIFLDGRLFVRLTRECETNSVGIRSGWVSNLNNDEWMFLCCVPRACAYSVGGLRVTALIFSHLGEDVPSIDWHLPLGLSIYASNKGMPTV